MKKITFIRHGESAANAGGISQPNANIPLTERGIQQAQMIADQWQDSPSQVYVSEFIRTKQTAQPLLDKYHLQPITLAGLNEFNTFGYEIVAGMTGAERTPLTLKYWKEADPDARYGESGQTYREFCQQVADFIPILCSLEEQSIIYGHGMWIRQLIWQSLGMGDIKNIRPKEMKKFIKFALSLTVSNTAIFDIYLSGSLFFIIAGHRSL